MSDTMPIPDDVARLMKRCQVGVGGRGALDEAHSIMADCYGMLGRLAQENARLHAAVERVSAGLRAAEEDAGRYAYAKTLEGQVVVMETLMNRGAAELDHALDDAMAEEDGAAGS